MSTISNNLPAPPDGFSTTLSASISSNALSIPLNSVSGLGTEGVGQLFKKDSNGDVIPGSVEYIHWTNVSGNTLTLSDTGDRGITGSAGGAQAFSSGDYFEVWVSGQYYYKKQRDGFLSEHNQDGTHNFPNSVISSPIHSATSKTTPVDADELPIIDSAASNILKKLTWANLKATLFGLIETPSDLSYSGLTVTMTAGENLVPGDIVFFKSDGKVWKVDADAIATMPAMGMAVATIAAGNSGVILLQGIFRNDTLFNWTVGGFIYASGTPGPGTQTQPSGVDGVIQVIGIATHADRMYFKPDLTYITHI